MGKNKKDLEIEEALQLQRTNIRISLQSLLENGHGGGNWRRLLIQFIETLKD